MHRARSATIHQEEPIWEQFCALLPERKTNHPLGCHRSRIPEKVVFGKLVQILVFSCAYERIADKSCSESTLRRRRDEWIELGLMENLREISRCRIERACTGERLRLGHHSLWTGGSLVGRRDILKKGKPAAFKAGLRWVVERTNSCQAKLAHKKLVYGEEWASDRFLGGFLRCCDNRQATHPRRLESLPLGG